MRNAILAAVLGIWLSIAGFRAEGAEVSVEPSAPRSLDTISIHVDAIQLPGAWADPDVSMASGKITVTLHEPGSTVEGPNPDLDWSIGQLPAGSYQVEVIQQWNGGSTVSIGQASFVVAARTDSAPRADYTDMWWNPSESGWGMSIHQHASDSLFVVWFVYSADGSATWYCIPSGQWESNRQYSGAVYKTKGPFFGGPFDATAVSVLPVGSATLNFKTYDSAAFQYSIDGVKGEKSITRQSF